MEQQGILYVVWGTKTELVLERSIASVKKYHPELPIHVERVPVPEDPLLGLQAKSRMFSFSPFVNTLYLDADTIVLGRLDFGFTKSEQFGIAVSICECPWLRRYQGISDDSIEYNTGVIFFSQKAKFILQQWEEIGKTFPSNSLWTTRTNEICGSRYDDQASFSLAIERNNFCPYTLPQNWNFRPDFYKTFFAPLKIWHSYQELPEGMEELSRICTTGERFVTYIELTKKSGQ